MNKLVLHLDTLIPSIVILFFLSLDVAKVYSDVSASLVIALVSVISPYLILWAIFRSMGLFEHLAVAISLLAILFLLILHTSGLLFNGVTSYIIALISVITPPTVSGVAGRVMIGLFELEVLTYLLERSKRRGYVTQQELSDMIGGRFGVRLAPRLIEWLWHLGLIRVEHRREGNRLFRALYPTRKAEILLSSNL